MNVLTIEYDALTGTPVADGMCEELVLDMYCRGFTHFKTGSDNLILATRALIAEGILPNTEIQFKFKDQIMKPDSDGRFSEWPNGFCDCSSDWLMRIMKPARLRRDEARRAVNEANAGKAFQG